MKKSVQRIGGLQPLTEDPRDFQLGALVKLPDLKELPKNYRFKHIKVKDQGGSDFCSAYATCAISELQEGVELEPSVSFAFSKLISGDPDGWGQNPRDAMKAHQKFGAVEVADIPDWSVQKKDIDLLRKIQNYPQDVYKNAQKHVKSSYFKVTGQYDAFDNIRASLWQFRNHRRAPAFGVVWNWDINNPMIEEYVENGYGHMIACIGWETIDGLPYLVIQNSYGTGVGDKGFFYMSRHVVNKNVDRYGSWMFIDMTPEDAKNLIKKMNPWYINLFNALKVYWWKIWK